MIQKALLKAFKKYSEKNGSHFKIEKIDTNEKKIYYKVGSHPYVSGNAKSTVNMFSKNSYIYDIIRLYLKLKEKIWFNKNCIVIYSVLRKLLGKDIARFVCELIKYNINICISNNLNKFNELGDLYNNSKNMGDRQKFINDLFTLCEFTETICF